MEHGVEAAPVNGTKTPAAIQQRALCLALRALHLWEI
jgi:hypothetical protein